MSHSAENDAPVDVLTLRKGDTIAYTADGRTDVVTVQTDPEHLGSPGSRAVTIGYGPGRWNRSVSNDGQAFGFYVLTRVIPPLRRRSSHEDL